MQPAQQPPSEGANEPGRDPLPEYLDWRDSGCEVAPRCLQCPLPRCRYDDPGGLRAILNEYRDAAIVRARGRGRTADEIAAEFGVSRRTVFRVLRRTGHGRGGRRCGPEWRKN